MQAGKNIQKLFVNNGWLLLFNPGRKRESRDTSRHSN
jgi:hypothetical protein